MSEIKTRAPRSAESRARMAALMKAKWADPKYKTTQLASFRTVSDKARRTMKDKWADPEYRKKTIAALRHTTNSDEFKAKISISSKARWTDPEYRRKLAVKQKSPESLEKRKNTYITKKQEISTIFELSWQNPNAREARCQGMKIKANSAEQKQKNLASLKINGKRCMNIPKHMVEHPKALHVKLRDPRGRVWVVHNLNKFIAEHPELFEPKHLEFRDNRGRTIAAHNLSRLTAKKSKRSTAMGWTLVSDTEVFYNGGEDLLNRQQHEVHSI